MSTRIETTIKIDSWDEKPTAEYDDGTKVAHAVVGLVEGNDGLSAGHLESVLYYGADGTSTYVGLIHLDADLDGRSGSFTAVGEGAYDGTTASSTMRIVEGTGDLAGITGTVASSSTEKDYPNMPLVLEYELGVTAAAESRGALANVLGALSLVVSDELGRAVTKDARSSGSVTDAATLSALAQFLDGATLDRVHQVVGVTPSGAVRLVDRLERERLVTREAGSDRRSRAVRLTAVGRAAAGDIATARSAYLAGIVDTLSAEEVDALRALLAKVMAGVVQRKDGGAWTCRLCDLVACRRSEGECPAMNAAQERYAT